MYALCLRGEDIEVGRKLMCSLSIGSVHKTHFFLTSLPTFSCVFPPRSLKRPASSMSPIDCIAIQTAPLEQKILYSGKKLQHKLKYAAGKMELKLFLFYYLGKNLLVCSWDRISTSTTIRRCCGTQWSRNDSWQTH